MVGRLSRTALRSVLLAVVAALAVLPVTAASAVEDTGAAPVEEDQTSPTVDEIGSGSQTAQGHLPEEAELPPFQRFLFVPLIVGGILIVALLLFRYLQWQPRFAEERRSKRRR